MVGLSEEDIERIQSFANTPRYNREPTNLMPEESETETVHPEPEDDSGTPGAND
jgi:hypothetical protein